MMAEFLYISGSPVETQANQRKRLKIVRNFRCFTIQLLLVQCTNSSVFLLLRQTNEEKVALHKRVQPYLNITFIC